jgi:hypothetical protein
VPALADIAVCRQRPPGLAWAFTLQHAQQLELTNQHLDLGLLFVQNVLDIFHPTSSLTVSRFVPLWEMTEVHPPSMVGRSPVGNVFPGWLLATIVLTLECLTGEVENGFGPGGSPIETRAYLATASPSTAFVDIPHELAVAAGMCRTIAVKS